MWLVVVALAAMINLRLKVQVEWVPKSTMVIGTVEYTFDPRIHHDELFTALKARVLSYSLTCTSIKTRLSRAEAVRDETC